MAPPTFETKLLDIIPKFDGNPLELSFFIDTSNTLINTYWNSETVDCVQNLTLIYGIYAKLIGKAREVYSICVSKDWKSVKDALIAHFGDQRDENGLLFDLDQLRQYNNEVPLQYYTRVMSNLSALHNFIDTHPDISDSVTKVKKDFYNLHALKIFLAGLREPLGSTIRAMKPKDLAEARQYIISESNIRHLQKPHQFDNNTNPHNNKFKNQRPQQKFLNQYPQNNWQQPNFHQPPSFGNYQPQNPQFPRGPINVQPRTTPPQKFFTNRQVFGPPRHQTNVWKPNPHAVQNFPRPVPMSGVSHGTNRSFQRPQNSFQLHNEEENHPYYPETQYYAMSSSYYENDEYYNNNYDTNLMQNDYTEENYTETPSNNFAANDLQDQAANNQNFQEAPPSEPTT